MEGNTLMETKTCNKCGETKEVSLFREASKTCKKCRSQQQKEWRERNQAHFDESCRRRHLKTRYGMTLEQYNEMLEEQQGKCAICDRHGQSPGNKRNLDVDHCHKTGKIRGLLCNRCNQSMGKVKDDIDLLKKFLAYLLKWERTHED